MTAWRQQGLSLLEFTLIALLVGVLMAVAIDRMVALRVDMERAAVQHAVARMRAALAVEFAELIVKGRRDRIEAWAGGNPMRLLDTREGLNDAPRDPSGPGDWRYDANAGELIYRPAYPEALTGDPDAVGRWRVVVRNSGGGPTGLDLRPVEPLLPARRTENDKK